MNPIPRLQPYSGPAFLSYGFRPFFLFGAIYAGLGILIWLPLFSGQIVIPTAFSPLDWHVHEMLYGYLPAAITGFLLTAIPNWTGRMPLRGKPVAALAAVWILGRLAVSASGVIGRVPAGIIDNAFLCLIAVATTREVVVGRNWRNLPPILIVLVFLAGNVAFHVEDYWVGSARFGARIGIGAAIVLISLIGGRVVPSFTHNWLRRANPGRLPAPFDRFDIAVLIASFAAVALWIPSPDSRSTAVLMIVAGLGQTTRLARWAGERTLGERLVLILHIAYSFLPLGFFMLAGAVLFPRWLPASAGIHAWTVGAIGTMTLAIMTRASLGHTGQALTAGALTQAVYVAVVFAALARTVAAILPATGVLLYISGAAWVAAFWMFALGYGPLLLRPRENTRRQALPR